MHFCTPGFRTWLHSDMFWYFWNFVFVLWVTKYFFNTIKFYTISFLCKHNFFIDEKRTQWMLGTKAKVFRESMSCFMKSAWNCILWNALKEKFHSVSFPLHTFWTSCPYPFNFIKSNIKISWYEINFFGILRGIFNLWLKAWINSLRF